MADNKETDNKGKIKIQIPDEFKKIIVDMTKDILISFPEQEVNLHKELKNLLYETDKDGLEQSIRYIYVFCKTIYPVRFFDILYQNNSIFDTEKDLQFLPGVNFVPLWKENISDKTRETIWKYLQLVLFTIVSSISDGNTFGDTAKLFEAINEDDFKSKLEETITQMHTLFGADATADTSADPGADTGADAETGASGKTGINLEDLPNPSDIHEHVTSMMNGKLGKLAREIAEETAADLNINMENAESINDVFKRLIKNPTKLLGLVKNVGSKLDSKLKSGDMKESELLEEASELMKKMKNMPGMGDLQSMLSKMGMNAGGGLGGKGGGKVNVSAMQSNLEKKLKEAKNRERLLKKVEEKKAAAEAAAAEAEMNKLYASAYPEPKAINTADLTDAIADMENLVFSTGEKVERSTPGDKKKNKKNKKK
jgi:hypothetical protein